MIPRCIVVSLLLFSLFGCLGSRQAGIVDYGTTSDNVTVYRSGDDVSMFSYPPDQKEIDRLAQDWQGLRQKLEELVDAGNYNQAAFLAAYAPAVYDARLIEWMEERITGLTPPFMYVLARKYDASDTRTALKWYLRGHVLSRVDAKLCLDKSAPQGVRFLPPLLGPNLREKYGEYKASGLVREESLAALEYARTYDPSYTPMWICSHGMSSFLEGGNAGHEPKDKRGEKVDMMEESFHKQ